MSYFQEKFFFWKDSELSVPETDTGGEVENTKERERTLLKELGKIAL
jgi:hypothetical protein